MKGNIAQRRVGELIFTRVSDPSYNWEALEKSLYYEGYQPHKYGYIRVHKNRVLNGNHRLQIITRSKSNLDKCIEVKTVSDFNYFTGLFFTLLFMPIYLPIMLFPFFLRKVGILKQPDKVKWSGKYKNPNVNGLSMKIWKQ